MFLFLFAPASSQTIRVGAVGARHQSASGKMQLGAEASLDHRWIYSHLRIMGHHHPSPALRVFLDGWATDDQPSGDALDAWISPTVESSAVWKPATWMQLGGFAEIEEWYSGHASNQLSSNWGLEANVQGAMRAGPVIGVSQQRSAVAARLAGTYLLPVAVRRSNAVLEPGYSGLDYLSDYGRAWGEVTVSLGKVYLRAEGGVHARMRRSAYLRSVVDWDTSEKPQGHAALGVGLVM